MSALHSGLRTNISAELVGSVLRVLRFYAEYRQSRTDGNSEPERKDDKEETDVQLKALVESAADFLSIVLMEIPEDLLSSLVKEGHLTEKNCISAVSALLPQYTSVVQHMVSLLSEVEPKLADKIKKDFSISSDTSR